MATIQLTRGKETIVDDEYYQYLNQWKWHACTSTGKIWYAVRSQRIKGTYKRIFYKMHRVILGLTDPNIFCDHRDHNGLNNQKANLRIATKEDNARNKSVSTKSTSKYLGVCWHKASTGWAAKLYTKGSYIWIGTFKDEVEAAKAYNTEASKHFGEFANINKV